MRPLGLKPRTVLAVATLGACVLVVALVGLDAWILRVWAIVLAAGVVLGGLGYLLRRELGGPRAPARQTTGNRRMGNWTAGGLAAFLSCTMAAGLVRSAHPERDAWLLGALMLAAVVNLRVAYARTGAATST